MKAVTMTATLDSAAPVVPAAPCAPCLHQHPPATPGSFFREHRHLLLAIGAIFGFLAVSAAIADAWLLLRWDSPIQHFVEDNRSAGLDTFFLTMSRFGSTMVVLSVGVLLSALTWKRCRAVSIAIFVATFGRPLVETLLKQLVGRDRPDLERMVNGHGPSFPSGHVMAAVALWGLLPLVVGLFTRKRWIWWMSVAFSAYMILSIAASRVYLGVHWPSDVFAGLLLGSFFLLGIEQVLFHVHRVNGCGAARRDASAESVPAS
ncbi:MAG: phosphatase PAP2 family protein [Acidimicrobiia bacterium]